MSILRPRMISLIAAVGLNQAIGYQGNLVWRHPEDLKHFKQTTWGCPVVMGRKTWDSLGKPLPGRLNVVITRQPDWLPTGELVVAHSLEEAFMSTAQHPKVFVIGGEQIYRMAIPVADELILTEVQEEFTADAFFPAWSKSDFIEHQRRGGLDTQGRAYAFVTYKRLSFMNEAC
jgi:dihydrofolate reductase